MPHTPTIPQISISGLLIQIGNGADWDPCRVFHMCHGNNHYVRMSIEGGRDHITLYGLREALAHKLRALLALIENSDIPEPTAGFITQREVTPAETVQKFQASDILSPLAGEVETVLAGMLGDAERVRAQLDPAALFDRQGLPIRGAQARIAEALGVENAGAYRRRILDTLQTLQRENSTTPERPQTRSRTA